MGHLINPISTRLGTVRTWNSTWVSSSNLNYYYLLNKDLALQKALEHFFFKPNSVDRWATIFEKILIERAVSKTNIYITIYSWKYMDLVNNCLKAVSFSGQSPLLLKQLFFPESALMPQVTRKLSSFSQSHEPDAFAFFKEKFNHVFFLGRELKGPFTLFFQNKLKQEFISNIVKQVKNRMVCGYMKGFMLTVLLQIYCRNKFSLNHYYVYLYCNIVRIKELLRFFSKVSFWSDEQKKHFLLLLFRKHELIVRNLTSAKFFLLFIKQLLSLLLKYSKSLSLKSSKKILNGQLRRNIIQNAFKFQHTEKCLPVGRGLNLEPLGIKKVFLANICKSFNKNYALNSQLLVKSYKWWLTLFVRIFLRKEIMRYYGKRICMIRGFIKYYFGNQFMSNNCWNVFFVFPAHLKLTAHIVAYVIRIRLTQKYSLNELLTKFVNLLNRQENLLGYRITCTGRFTRRQRATFRWIKSSLKGKDKLSLNTFSTFVDYAYTEQPLKYGLCGIKVWLVLTDAVDVNTLPRVLLSRQLKLKRFFYLTNFLYKLYKYKLNVSINKTAFKRKSLLEMKIGLGKAKIIQHSFFQRFRFKIFWRNFLIPKNNLLMAKNLLLII